MVMRGSCHPDDICDFGQSTILLQTLVINIISWDVGSLFLRVQFLNPRCRKFNQSLKFQLLQPSSCKYLSVMWKQSIVLMIVKYKYFNLTSLLHHPLKKLTHTIARIVVNLLTLFLIWICLWSIFLVKMSQKDFSDWLE